MQCCHYYYDEMARRHEEFLGLYASYGQQKKQHSFHIRIFWHFLDAGMEEEARKI